MSTVSEKFKSVRVETSGPVGAAYVSASVVIGGVTISVAPDGYVDASKPPKEYTEEQFVTDLQKASKPLTALADKARKNLQEGTAKEFPV